MCRLSVMAAMLGQITENVGGGGHYSRECRGGGGHYSRECRGGSLQQRM